MSKKEKEVKEPTALELQYAKVISPKNFKEWNKTDFKKEFKGKLPFDLNKAWDWIVANRK